MLVGLFVVASVLLTSGATEAQEFATSPSPPAGKALVYVYRGRLLGLGPFFFIDGDFLADFFGPGYTSREVPQGTVVFATLPWSPSSSLSPYFLRNSGCEGPHGQIWRHLDVVPDVDVERCRGELLKALSTVNQNQSRYYPEICGDFSLPTRTRALVCAGDLTLALRALMQKPKELLRIDVETGTTYYVKWSPTRTGGRMTLMDAATGAKEISGLQHAAPF